MEGSPDRSPLQKPSLIIGRQPILEALESGHAIDRIMMQANLTGDIIGKIRVQARQRGVPVQVVPSEKLNALTRSVHQGIIAIGALVSYLTLDHVIQKVTASGQAPLFVMLDGITDVRNIGGIARTCVCCGVQAIIIPDKGVGALNEEAMKASAGALEKMLICRVSSLLKAVDEMHSHGIAVWAAESGSAKTLPDMDFRMPLCIVMGSEGRGVQDYIAKAADGLFSIPMTGQFDSFNVSVASGIILYEAMKQRL